MRQGWLANLLRRPTAAAGAALLVLAALSAVFAPWVAPHDPYHINASGTLRPPGGGYLLGTDELGRDTLSRLIYGGRVSLSVALGAVLVAAVVGVAAGGVASVFGRWIEALVLRVTDILLVFPEILLAIVLMALLGLSMTNVVIAIAVAYVPRFVRLTWASLLVLREEPFVQAARVSGSSQARIMVRHLLPNILPVLAVQATTSLASAVLVESSLSFLGLGVQPPRASWGSMINSGLAYFGQDAWVTVFPGIAILLTALSFNFVGDAIAEGLNPRLRGPGEPATVAEPAAVVPAREAP